MKNNTIHVKRKLFFLSQRFCARLRCPTESFATEQKHLGPSRARQQNCAQKNNALDISTKMRFLQMRLKKKQAHACGLSSISLVRKMPRPFAVASAKQALCRNPILVWVHMLCVPTFHHCVSSRDHHNFAITAGDTDSWVQIDCLSSNPHHVANARDNF